MILVFMTYMYKKYAYKHNNSQTCALRMNRQVYT